MPLPTNNLILLAAEGAKYLKLFTRGPSKDCYLPMPGKRGATHRLHSTRPCPRYDPKHAPRSRVRIIYGNDIPGAEMDFPTTTEGREQAAAKLATWKELALNAAPTSAVAVPFGKSYKTFARLRAEAASNGSLYEKHKNQKQPKSAFKTMAKNKSTAAPKDTKNGMTRPKEGTTCRKVWDLADKHNGERAAVLKEAASRKVNEATAMTQFGKWRVYHGLVGKKAKPAAKRKPAPPAKRKPAPPKRKPAPPAAAPAAV